MAKPDADCREPGFCLAPLVCVGGQCLAPAAPGEPCAAGGQPCLWGLVCLSLAGEPGRCALPRRTEESCASTLDCHDPAGHTLVCVGGRCAVAPAAGEPCFDYLCDVAWCDVAQVSPRCEPWPADGDPCVGGALCGPGAWCDAGTCRPLQAGGSPCVAASQCLSGRCLAGRCGVAGEPPCPVE